MAALVRARAVLAVTAAFPAALVAASPAAGEGGEPITLSVNVPAVVASGVAFPVRVTVAADPKALGAATAPLRVRVKAAAECGASFDSTPGRVLLDAPLGQSGRVAGAGVARTFGSFTACTYLEQQGDDRLFAFDDSSTFAVTHPCTTATRRVLALTGSLDQVRKALRHAHGGHRQALARRAARLHTRLVQARTARRRACSG